jgi:alpha-N-arabinofuranosidase
MEDALVVGGMLITLLSHADRVRIGCLAQVVNVIAPIMTEPGGRVWKQPTYHPFAAASLLGRGTVLRSLLKAPAYDCDLRDQVPAVMVASVADGDSLTVFAVNRDSEGRPVQLSGVLRGFERFGAATHQVLAHPDLKAVNTADQPEHVAPRSADEPPVLADGGFTAVLPPYSWNVLRFGN